MHYVQRNQQEKRLGGKKAHDLWFVRLVHEPTHMSMPQKYKDTLKSRENHIEINI